MRLALKRIVQNLPPPSMYVDFATDQNLGLRKTNTTLTFTRAASGTYFDRDLVLQTGATNAARFDYNPTTGKSLGLLIEEARTNSFLYSEQADNAAWSKIGATVTANGVIAPDGNSTADTLVNTAGIISLFQQNITVPASSTNDYYPTCFVKLGVVSDANKDITFNCYYNGNAEDNVSFRLSNLTASAVPYSGEYICQNVGNGWYRIGFRMTRDATGLATLILVRMWVGRRSVGVIGDTQPIWGVQLEKGAFPTSYIPTTTAAATRAVDVCSTTSIAPWFNAVEGAFVVGGTMINPAGTQVWLGMHNGTSNERFRVINTSATQTRLSSITGGSETAAINIATAFNGQQKLVAAYKDNDYGFSINSGEVGTDTAVIFPVVTTLAVGNDRGLIPLNGWISSIAYYPRRLPNTLLQRLSK